MNLFWTLFLCALGFQSTFQLLPKTVIPLKYRLDLYINLGDQHNDFRFSGGVWITIKCLEKTNTITLHSKNLQVSNVTSDITNMGAIQFDQKGDLLTLRLPADLEKDNVNRIGISFAGKFEEGSKKGFFLRRAENPKTHQKEYKAITYFEDRNAREVFPCFDEPEFNTSIFQVNIAHDKKYQAVSGTEEVGTESVPKFNGNWIWTVFNSTKPQKTDDVNFAVFGPIKPLPTDLESWQKALNELIPPKNDSILAAKHLCLVRDKTLLLSMSLKGPAPEPYKLNLLRRERWEIIKEFGLFADRPDCHRF